MALTREEFDAMDREVEQAGGDVPSETKVRTIFGDDRNEVEMRVPPHDLKAEAAICCAFMVDDADTKTLLAASLEPEQFYSEAHRRIFEACRALHAGDKAVDHVTVHAWLAKRKRLAQVGGIEYLATIADACPTLRGVRDYVAIVLDKWRVRRAIEAAQRLATEGYAGAHDADKLLRSTLEELGALSSASGGALTSRIVSAEASWLTEPPPARDYLVRDGRTGKGAMYGKGVAILAAEGSAGKGFTLLSLAQAVSTGGAWLGCMTVESAGRVLYVTAEDPVDEVQRRWYHVGRSGHVESVPPGSFEVLNLHGVHFPLLDPHGCPTANATELVELVRSRGPFALVIVDTLTRLAGAAIDVDNVSASTLITVLEQVAGAAGGLLVATHHTSGSARRTGVTDANSFRGATALRDTPRLGMTLAKEYVEHEDPDVAARLGNLVVLRCVKANYHAEWEPVRLRRGEHGELLPLDAPDVERIAQARKAGQPEGREAAKEAKTRAQDVGDDDAARAVMAKHPDASVRELVALVRKVRACGGTRAHAAVVRARRQQP